MVTDQSAQLLSQRLNTPNSSSMYGYLSDTMLTPSQTYFISLLTQPLRVTAQVKDQAQSRLPRSNRAVFKPTCSAPSKPVSTSIPSMDSQGPKLQNQRPSHFSQVQNIWLFLYPDSGAAEERGQHPNRYRQHPRHFTPTAPQNSLRSRQLLGSLLTGLRQMTQLRLC